MMNNEFDNIEEAMQKLRLAEVGRQCQECFMKALEKYGDMDEEMLLKIVATLEKYDISALMANPNLCQDRIKLLLDKESLDVQVMGDWLNLPEDEKLDKNQVKVFLDACKSMNQTTAVLDAMRRFINKVSDLVPDLEIIVKAMSGKEEE